MTTLAETTEHAEAFACFGSQCGVIVADDPRSRSESRAALASAKRQLLQWHAQFSRFRPDSELSCLNDDPRPVVTVTAMMRRVLEAATTAARLTGGLVDPTLLDELERAGYDGHLDGPGLPLEMALAAAPQRATAAPSDAARWQTIHVDRRNGTVTRPPGVKLDPGGIAKGVFADELGARLSGHGAYVLDCAGDIALGGRAGTLRDVHVASPFDHSTLYTFELARGAVATSGIGARSWLLPDGGPGHHLLDPRTGRPAFTGVVQATALAPSAAEAEALSKAAILSGPARAREWLVHGGVVVLDDGSHQVVGSDLGRRRLVASA